MFAFSNQITSAAKKVSIYILMKEITQLLMEIGCLYLVMDRY